MLGLGEGIALFRRLVSACACAVTFAACSKAQPENIGPAQSTVFERDVSRDTSVKPTDWVKSAVAAVQKRVGPGFEVYVAEGRCTLKYPPPVCTCPEVSLTNDAVGDVRAKIVDLTAQVRGSMSELECAEVCVAIPGPGKRRELCSPGGKVPYKGP